MSIFRIVRVASNARVLRDKVERRQALLLYVVAPCLPTSSCASRRGLDLPLRLFAWIVLGCSSTTPAIGAGSGSGGSMTATGNEAGATSASMAGAGTAGTAFVASGAAGTDGSTSRSGAGGNAHVGGSSVGAGASGDTSNAGAPAAGSPGKALFNGVDLTGFDAFREPSTALTAEQTAAIFKVEDASIRVYGDAPDQSTQARYTLVTQDSYSRYRLSLEYKWGTKKFAPYTDLERYPRDAGVLFHLHGDTHQVWPASIEFQIKDGTTGDIFAIYARCTSLAQGGGTVFVPAEAGGTEKLVNGSNGFVQHGRSQNFELPDWNQLLLEVDGGAAKYWVNGQLVNQVLSVMDKSGDPISAGPIALQAEHAEVFYRAIVIEELP